jgi:branched-subunit amino acid aminotransferase/4-amino-4-deoxychorismate lyase
MSREGMFPGGYRNTRAFRLHQRRQETAMGPQFFETGYGRRFFDSQLPRLTAALERLADAAEKPKGTDDATALDAIAAVLHGHEWNADALVTIADVVRRTGRVVDDVNEEPAATE